MFHISISNSINLLDNDNNLIGLSYPSTYDLRNVNLQYGVNNIEIKVKAENESVKVYTIKVTREDGRSSNNSLKSLSVSNTNINFDKNITTYNLSVKNDIETIEISAQADDNNILYLIIISKKTKTKDFINNTNS